MGVSLAQARQIVISAVCETRVETVAAEDAVGRVFARDVVSDMDVSPFDNSAMDGFALRSDDLASATGDMPVELACVGHIGAGDVLRESLAPGTCARIMTGAAVPQGADAVVMLEDAAGSAGGSTGDMIAFCAPTRAGANIRYAGEEACAGSVVLRAGTEMYVRPALRRMQGHSRLDRPRVPACLAQDEKKRDGRLYLQKGVVEKLSDGSWEVRSAGSQSPGPFCALGLACTLAAIAGV